MLDEYRQMVARLRQDHTTWGDVSFRAGRDTDGDWIDVNARRRYGALLCLQYDRRRDDHDLIRHLFTEETTARQEDSFQGYGDALHVGAALLAGFRDVRDAWLFFRAKMANFDTFAGFDRRYLLAGGIDATLAMVQEGDERDRAAFLELVIDDGALVYDQEQIDAWWTEDQRALPASEADEPLLERVNHALALEAIEEGRAFLDAWEASQGADGQMARTLRYYRSQLGQPERALAAAWRVLDAVQGDPWERSSALQDVARFATQVGQYDIALGALDEAGALLDGRPDWKRTGLARRAVELACELASAAAAIGEVGRRAFALAMRLADDMLPLPLVVLRKAADAATAVGDARRAERYGALADDEERRIYGGRDKDGKAKRG